jgi:hypothetical protein
VAGQLTSTGLPCRRAEDLLLAEKRFGIDLLWRKWKYFGIVRVTGGNDDCCVLRERWKQKMQQQVIIPTQAPIQTLAAP